MVRIRCRYLDCQFLDGMYCKAAAVEIDPDEGCHNYKPIEEEHVDPDEDLANDDPDEDLEMEAWEDLEEDEDEEDAYDEE